LSLVQQAQAGQAKAGTGCVATLRGKKLGATTDLIGSNRGSNAARLWFARKADSLSNSWAAKNKPNKIAPSDGPTQKKVEGCGWLNPRANSTSARAKNVSIHLIMSSSISTVLVMVHQCKANVGQTLPSLSPHLVKNSPYLAALSKPPEPGPFFAPANVALFWLYHSLVRNKHD
jgi:hypothetical protein